jgi:peptidoglycan DL-endopeptidase CwlO
VHRLGATALALSLVTGLGGMAAASAADGHHTYPSNHQVHQAQHRAARAADDVAGIRAELAAANQRMQETAVKAEQAAEAYNGAQWRLQQARRDARAADRHARIASADVIQQRRSYAASVVSSYEMGPSLSPISAIQGSSGIGSVLSKLATLQNAQAAMDGTYDSFRASSTLAGVARSQADAARATALATQARQARDAAAAAASVAAATTQQIAARKTHLIHRLAALQHVSVHLAAKRQAGIEAAAQAAAQRAAETAARKAARKAARQQAALVAAQQAAQQQTDTGPGSGPTAAPTSPPTPEPSSSPTTPPSPPSPPTGPPAPASGAQAAIAFARAQIGDPYVWGATGPDAWDCSGLTMGAWRAGGISLPHYSVAQYEQSTPISASSLRPGDLVFWGSSSSPSSIYHVALYVGNGMIIQAPRTGRDVEEVSMYYWITPNFYARP